MVHHIRNSEGSWIESETMIRKEAALFFQSLFSAVELPSSYNMLKVIPRLVSNEDNHRLSEIPLTEEVN